MHSNTIRYLDYLNGYVRRMHSTWMDSFSDVVGISVSNKHRRGVKRRYYAIVFHVHRKKDNVPTSSLIPQWFEVKIPGRGSVKVPTDVVETGEFELCSAKPPITPGSTASNLLASASGSAGPLAVDGRGKYYVISNMHVLGKQYLNRGYYDVVVPEISQKPTVCFTNSSGFHIDALFTRGTFGGALDIAMARIENDDICKVMNIIPGEGRPTGILDIDSSSYIGTEVNIYGSISGKQSSKITCSDAIISLWLNNKKISLTNLIQFSPACSKSGDSGCPVFNPSLKILGIIVGRDKKFSYAIKIEKALKYLKVKLVL